MFERFTDRARRVLVLSQEEARLFHHDFIGTEHILLGLIREQSGVAAKALHQMGVTLASARQKVGEAVGIPEHASTGGPPFTPRAKKVLELSLREALALQHNYIGTEHILLGIEREGEGIGARVLADLGAGPERTRATVLALLGKSTAEETHPAPPAYRSMPRRARASYLGRQAESFVFCSFCGLEPPDSGRVIAGADAFICEHCIRKWFGSLQKPLQEHETGVAEEVKLHDQRSTGSSSRGTGPHPDHLAAAHAEVVAAFAACRTVSEDGQAVESVEGGATLGPTLLAAQTRSPFPSTADITIEVSRVEFTDAEHAEVTYTVTTDGVPRLSDRPGRATVVNGAWKVARSTFCDLMRLAGVECPPATP